LGDIAGQPLPRVASLVACAAVSSLAPGQPLTVVVWHFYHMAIGGAERPVIPRSHPEQVVVEVDLA